MDADRQRYFFRKDEHLCLRNDINEVVAEGKRISAFPLVANYIIKTDDNGSKPRIAISVAKRNFKKAVDRNLLKRRIREAYRVHKSTFVALANEHKKLINFIVIYVPKEKLQYAEIEKGIVKLLAKLCESIEKHSDISSTCAD